MSTITTTDGKHFHMADHADMARLVYRRFGHDLVASTAAWRRLLQNSATEQDFLNLLNYPTHTPNCEGDCRCLDPHEHDYHSAVRATS